MKFAAALQRCAEHSAVISDVHAMYKLSKKLMKGQDAGPQVAALLAAKVAEWHEHYMDTEEDLVIECSDLQTASNEHNNDNHTASYELLQALVDFHGRQVERADYHIFTAAACQAWLVDMHDEMTDP